jgi:hypothetical protein
LPLSHSPRDRSTDSRLPPTRRRPQARVDAAAAALAKDPRFKKLSLKYLQQVTDFVVGNTLFVVLHELGHAATSEMKLPILGRREDAADAFAVIQLVKLDHTFTDGVLEAAAKGWFMSDRRDKKTETRFRFTTSTASTSSAPTRSCA